MTALNFIRRFLVVAFVLLFIANLLLSILDIGIENDIPEERKWTYRINGLVLFTLTVVTHKFLRKKYIDWLAKIWLEG